MKTINLKSILTLFFLAGHFVVLLSQPTGLGTQNAIQPFYIGEDQGAFYFAREGNKIRFVGENPVADYCIVFWGKQENDKISGKWWSLPKYGQSSRGTLEAKLIKDNEIVITEETGGFPTTALRPSVLNANIQRQLTYEKLPKWPNRIVNYNNSLSGAFKAEGKKIVCYTRQVGNFVRMYCESEASGSNKPSFSYLFLGQREGNRVDGKVYGLPKGKQSGVANATFFVQGESTLSSSSSFKLGSDTWKRKIPDFGKQIDEYVNSKPNNEGFLEPYASPGTFNIGSNQTSQGAKFCEEREWDYKKNIKSNTVLELTDLFPGQLIKINRALKEGNPQTIDQLARAPLTYTVSGNGLHFEGGGAFTVKDVKRSNYATKLQRKLNNQIRKNEYQPIQGEAETYSYWTKKQFLMDIGVNYSSLSASVLNNSGFEKDENNYIFSAFVRNAYYKVTVDEIEKPSDLFTPEVTLSMVENVHTSPNVRLGYVSSVTYGALMLLSFKVENNNSFVDIESAFKAIAGGGLVSGDVRTKYNELLQNVEITYNLF
ncbi:MAG: thiol-activated cytolysin family protein, partial [Bacteroidota bacterium]